MVQIIRKAQLPNPSEVVERLGPVAAQAHSIRLREPRPAGFPLLFTADLQIIEPAVAFLHEHFVQRAHTAETLRTYAEILYDWFETLEQNAVRWDDADAVDLMAYRNRMVLQPSGHTGRPYQVSTINHRVRGVLRFYEWAVRTRWLDASPLAGRSHDFALARQQRPARAESMRGADHSLFVLRQFEPLPRPLVSEQARELLATLPPPYDLMARWQIYTGLRVSELLRLGVKDVTGRRASAASHHTIDVTRKGRKPGYVIASASLLDETAGYLSGHRRAWLQRALSKGRGVRPTALFINARGAPVGKNAYQRVISRAGQACGFKATTHLLRATFACMLLARLEQLASQGAAINPLLVVKVLMGHERIETTDRYLRAIAVDACVLKEVLDTLLSGTQ
ncbi:MAG: tyrosine-type recombinase/integrase [Burkholderiales bacterium]|nr:tyrosine-type recombinase/integrase [Burkholderiales bacterium]